MATAQQERRAKFHQTLQAVRRQNCPRLRLDPPASKTLLAEYMQCSIDDLKTLDLLYKPARAICLAADISEVVDPWIKSLPKAFQDRAKTLYRHAWNTEAQRPGASVGDCRRAANSWLRNVVADARQMTCFEFVNYDTDELKAYAKTLATDSKILALAYHDRSKPNAATFEFLAPSKYMTPVDRDELAEKMLTEIGIRLTDTDGTQIATYSACSTTKFDKDQNPIHYVSVTFERLDQLAPQFASNDEFDRLLSTLDIHGRKIPGKQGAAIAKFTRLTDWKFWFRYIRTQVRRAHEYVAMRLGLVGGKTGNKYCSLACFNYRKNQLATQQEWLKSRWIRSDSGDIIPLSDVVRTNEHKFWEMYAVLKGLERYKKTMGWTFAMVTLTCPPEYHCNPVRGSNSWNPALTPKDGQRYLVDQWALFRTAMSNRDINYKGAWFCEPQQDGTPHWHTLVFYHPRQDAAIEREIIRLFGSPELIERFGDEYDIERDARIDFKRDNGSGSAVTYAMKYVMKTTNFSLDDADMAETVNHVDAWRSCWRLASHNFFGLDFTLGAYRELRRVTDKQIEAEPILRDAVTAARENRVEYFIEPNRLLVSVITETHRGGTGEEMQKPAGVRVITDDGVGEAMTRTKVWTFFNPDQIALLEKSTVNHNCPSGCSPVAMDGGNRQSTDPPPSLH